MVRNRFSGWVNARLNDQVKKYHIGVKKNRSKHQRFRGFNPFATSLRGTYFLMVTNFRRFNKVLSLARIIADSVLHYRIDPGIVPRQFKPDRSNKSVLRAPGDTFARWVIKPTDCKPLDHRADRHWPSERTPRHGVLNLNEHQQLPSLTVLRRMWFICLSESVLKHC